jgi:hypothetical protein
MCKRRSSTKVSISGLSLVCNTRSLSEYRPERMSVKGYAKLIGDRGEVRYTYTGNNSVAHTGLGPAVDFQVIPTEVSAVA